MKSEAERERERESKTPYDYCYDLYSIGERLATLSMVVVEAREKKDTDIIGFVEYVLNHLSQDVIKIAVALDEGSIEEEQDAHKVN